MPSSPTPASTPCTRAVRIAGVCLLVGVPLALDSNGYEAATWPKLLVAQGCALLVVAAWAFCAHRGNARPGRLPLDLPAALLLCSALYAWTAAINPLKSGLEIAKLLTFLALYLAVSRTVRTAHLLPWARATAWTAAGVSIIGIAQYLGLGFLWIRSTGYPSATFLYRNFAAMYLILALPLSALPFLFARNARTETLWGLPCALALLFLLYTRTRGAWVGLAGAILLIGVLLLIARRFSWPVLAHLRASASRRKLCIALLYLILAGAGAMYSPQYPRATTIDPLPDAKTSIVNTVASIQQTQDSGRLRIWGHTLEIIATHPLLGIGLGNWDLIFPRYEQGKLIAPGTRLARPHNDYLWIASERGLIGLLIYLYLLCAAFWLFAKTLRKADHPHQSLALLAGLTGLLAISGHAVFSFPIERITPSTLSWLLLGIGSGIAAGDARAPAKRSPLRALLPPIACACVLIVSLPHTVCVFHSNRAFYQVLILNRDKAWHPMRRAAERAIAYGIWDYRILLWKARACEHLGDLRCALEASRQSLAYHPNSRIAYWNIGKLAHRLEHPEQSLDALLKARELDARNGDIYRELGTVYQILNRPDDALQTYRTALELGPQDAPTLSSLGGLYLKKGMHPEALDAYRKAVRQDTAFVRAHMGLGVAASLLGQTEDAISAYETTLRLQPNRAEIYASLGLLYQQTERPGRALWAYRTFLKHWTGAPEIADAVRAQIRKMEATSAGTTGNQGP